jgi:hypothetical protein
MPLSRAQLIRNRIGGMLRQNPGADVTDLRREMEISAILDQAEAYARKWGKPTPEQVAAIAAIFRADTCSPHHLSAARRARRELGELAPPPSSPRPLVPPAHPPYPRLFFRWSLPGSRR